jgi:hypothetical protein
MAHHEKGLKYLYHRDLHILYTVSNMVNNKMQGKSLVTPCSVISFAKVYLYWQ